MGSAHGLGSNAAKSGGSGGQKWRFRGGRGGLSQKTNERHTGRVGHVNLAPLPTSPAGTVTGTVLDHPETAGSARAHDRLFGDPGAWRTKARPAINRERAPSDRVGQLVEGAWFVVLPFRNGIDPTLAGSPSKSFC